MEEQTLALRIFCAYASEDQALFRKLEQVLGIYRHQELVSLWHHGELLPGSEWDSEIRQQLHAADIILLLISPAFLDSEYSWNKEIQWAMTRHTIGDAHVVPIILKSTPGWDETLLGQLQALPADKKPITSWKKRDEAFADVVKGLRKVIEYAQREERYPVEEYMLEYKSFAYQLDNTPAEEVAKHRIEQWIGAIAQRGTLQRIMERDRQAEWIFIDQQQDCYITAQWSESTKHPFTDDFRAAMAISLTSRYASLLDQLIGDGQLPYSSLQWTLQDDLNVPALIQQIHEQSGRNFNSISRVPIYHVEYVLRRGTQSFEEDESVRIAFSSRGPAHPRNPPPHPRVCLTLDPYSSRRGFYHAHLLLSIRKLLAALCGELPYKDFWQLIDKACTP